MPMLAILGPGRSTESDDAAAARIATVAVELGWSILTGGGPGVMAAANRAAVEAGGVSVGVLPVAEPTGDYPNPWVQVPVFTGAGSARNQINVLSADLCVAISGGAGTLSEIGLALKAGREVWCLHSWGLTPPESTTCSLPRNFAKLDELIEALRDRC